MDAVSRRMMGLFQPGSPRVYTIPPGANFLTALAQELARHGGLADNPEALADALIYVPNRRSKQALAFALHQASPGRACLLPDIRALGDLEQDEPPPSAEAALAHLPPTYAPHDRLGALTRLVLAYYQSQDMDIPAVSALSAARELARLLDQAALSGDVDWQNLEALVPEAQLAGHWQQSVRFLEIIADHWPAHLEDAEKLDPYARRYAAAETMAAHWQAHPPIGPLIIAGSTGATPASRILMQAATQVQQGLVVLPGLDQSAPDAVWQVVAETPSHPQFTLARTLAALETKPKDVGLWPMSEPQANQTARRRLVHEALAPASSTADWTERLQQIAPDGDTVSFVETALQGMSLIEAGDDGEEALLAALLMRETLEHPGRTAALITPDAGLARRVSAMLQQWQVDVPPSAGLPLAQSAPGSLILLVADWLSDLSHPVKLMAVLNHAAVWFARDAVQALDRLFLRGPRLWASWDELQDHIAQADVKAADTQLARGLMLDLQTVLEVTGLHAPLPDGAVCEGALWLQQVAALASEVAAPSALWSGPDGAGVSNKLRELADLFAPLGVQPASVWTELLSAEMVATTIEAGTPHPRLAIWGPLEARLQSADRIFLAGLNEGIWPGQPAADAFLPRIMRARIGLSDPDERIGLSAHDFAQLATAPNVTLLTSVRRDDKPAIASRWVWRLRTLIRGALGDDAAAALAPEMGSDPQIWLRGLDHAPTLSPNFTAEPRPTPPLSARPKGLSVTRIEALIRDPYAIYGQYVLGLRRLDPLNLPADVRSRGTAIHAALERFEKEHIPATPENLLTLLEAELKSAGESETALISLRDRRLQVCTDYLAWRALTATEREGAALTEIKGQIALKIGAETFTLSGTADLVERRLGGKAAILDYKSGEPPTEKQVRSGLAPQMPLQGLIAKKGGYDELGPVEIEALTYLQFGTQFKVDEIGQRGKKDEQMDVADIIVAAEAGLVELLTRFADPDHPYLSAPRPERVKYESDYTRLARRGEWAGLQTFDE